MSKNSNQQQWLHALMMIAHHYRIDVAEENLLLELQWNRPENKDEVIFLATKQLGLTSKKLHLAQAEFNPWVLPLVVELDHTQVAVAEKIDAQGNILLRFSSDQGLAQTIALEEVKQHATAIYVLRPEHAVQDVRVDEYIKPFEKNWFWKIVLTDWKRYLDIMLASLIANVLALAAIVFSMNVYDRVIPAQSYPTLWVLASGVLIAAIFELTLRMCRTYLSDKIGKKADLHVSDRVYGHALRIQNKYRPKSTGSFISQIRELESIREMITSTTIGAIADLPFFFFFLIILCFIGSHVFWVVIFVVPLMILPALLSQKKLQVLATEGMRESSIRNAMLVESVQNIEDIKLLRAEARFQNQWNHMNETAADISMRQRKIAGFLTSWTMQIQNLTYVLVILVGCFAVISGEMTTGALVACSILSSRMLGPISNINNILLKWQNARVAKDGLDELMKKPVDHPERAHLIHKAALFGNYTLNHALFRYTEDAAEPTLAIKNLNIRAGEKIAILGRNGAGKSSLLQLLSGMQFIDSGQLTLDGLDMNLLDPDDIRRDMGLLNQHSQLFFGTIRENLTLGAPLSSDDEIIKALRMTNALEFVLTKKEGLDHLILEGGIGFSGGQKQALLLTRLILKNPHIVLLDEPTAAIDDISEKILIDHLQQWIGQKTLIVATHRQPILQLVDRVLVVNNGKIVQDIPKHELFLNKNKVATEEKNS
ncbi:type I secretion system permease/ATPase [Acinetobacter nectaris]|uniref:type I secretion system permease/ATPase n=1 Tax=Acinetobacter nectaris TaxID=1219382 RepID=UPI001F01C014|nr:type I secretion system permease/ATPase [Acinetobacter nectaris]MCF9000079.1 type I secretion system permease/ATPase [Acinetobacter nectaris]MCF9027033.1 type I secretion system permease/ATPase [Acinetobacter nectaris]